MRLRYYLLDSQRYPPEDLEGRRNAVACLWRLENCKRPQDLARVIDDLMRWFPGRRYQAMRRNFGLWLQRVLLPRNFPRVGLPENLPDLMEAKPMLVERVEQWKQEWKEEGLKKGLRKGLRKGLKEGRSRGLREGIHKGESRLLIQLLEHKFGSLSKEVRQRVAEADSPALREWTFKALDSNGLEQVFNGDGAKEAG